ncbi:MAG TPA: hypothetical protein VGM82_09665 [Gemmatimonadaceae bacterium]|jgi:hypothetical protein
MADDFEKGRRGEWSNVSDQREYDRGVAFQRGLNTSPMFAPPANGPVITGESPILQAIVCVPFVVAGTLLYPVTALLTVVAALLCVRLVPLFGPGAGMVRYFAYLPMLVVFWVSMRWDQRMGQRNAGYRRARHFARLVVFALVVAAVTGAVWRTNSGGAGQLITLPHLVGAVVGAALGHLFLTRGDGWRSFWYRTLATFRLRAAS